tara:strand:- start:260 stop:442 length:183 start_codon:yes stop_codon:yes gene_type:complete
MKSIKSLFAIIAIASLSFACASVTDASLADENTQPAIEQTSPSDAVFNNGGDPIILKPKV